MIQQSFKQSEEVSNDSVYIESPDDIIDFEEVYTPDDKIVKTTEVNSTKNILPAEYYKKD